MTDIDSSKKLLAQQKKNVEFQNISIKVKFKVLHLYVCM